MQTDAGKTVTEEPRTVRERVETRQLVNRQHALWRVLVALAVSTLLLLLALGLRRDQIVRQGALEDMQLIEDAMASYVHASRALPGDLGAILSQPLESLKDSLSYAELDRLKLAAMGQTPVALVYDLSPRNQVFSQDGRAVLLCKGIWFQVKWLTEQQFLRQRARELEAIERYLASPSVNGGTTVPQTVPSVTPSDGYQIFQRRR